MWAVGVGLTQSTPASAAVNPRLRLDPDVPMLAPESNMLFEDRMVSGVGKVEGWLP